MKRPPLGFCLAVSHADVGLAKLWLRWAVFLSQQKGGDVRKLKLLVVLSRRITEDDLFEIGGILSGPPFFDAYMARCEDEDERGYPGSSSHLFCRALQMFNKLNPKHAMMFCEADTVPLRPEWAHELAADYAARKKPFVGVHIPSTKDAVEVFGMPALHLTGCAMYPPNALELTPTIEQCLTARTDNCPWLEKGWAWDLFCAHEMIPESEQTDRIQQIWRSDPWTPDNLHRLSPRASLFHQSKDFSLVASLAIKRYPEFLDQLPKPSRCYQLEGGSSSITLAGREIKFRPAVRGCGGAIISIFAPLLPSDDLLLAGVAGRRGLSVISQADYVNLSAQADRNHLD